MLSLADSTLIAAQMGRKPRQVVAVAVRCPAGHPAVITSYPLQRRGGRLVPFPTLYWLTCPRLCQQVAQLEQNGAIAVLQAELDRDEILRAGLLANHQAYITQRWATLTPEDRLRVSQLGLREEFQSRGIGGMTHRAAVKCLHLHLAHHLVSGNVVGEKVIERYGLRPCDAVGHSTSARTVL